MSVQLPISNGRRLFLTRNQHKSPPRIEKFSKEQQDQSGVNNRDLAGIGNRDSSPLRQNFLKEHKEGCLKQSSKQNHMKDDDNYQKYLKSPKIHSFSAQKNYIKIQNSNEQKQKQLYRDAHIKISASPHIDNVDDLTQFHQTSSVLIDPVALERMLKCKDAKTHSLRSEIKQIKCLGHDSSAKNQVQQITSSKCKQNWRDKSNLNDSNEFSTNDKLEYVPLYQDECAANITFAKKYQLFIRKNKPKQIFGNRSILTPNKHSTKNSESKIRPDFSSSPLQKTDFQNSEQITNKDSQKKVKREINLARLYNSFQGPQNKNQEGSNLLSTEQAEELIYSSREENLNSHNKSPPHTFQRKKPQRKKFNRNFSDIFEDSLLIKKRNEGNLFINVFSRDQDSQINGYYNLQPTNMDNEDVDQCYSSSFKMNDVYNSDLFRINKGFYYNNSPYPSNSSPIRANYDYQEKTILDAPSQPPSQPRNAHIVKEQNKRRQTNGSLCISIAKMSCRNSMQGEHTSKNKMLKYKFNLHENKMEGESIEGQPQQNQRTNINQTIDRFFKCNIKRFQKEPKKSNEHSYVDKKQPKENFGIREHGFASSKDDLADSWNDFSIDEYINYKKLDNSFVL